MISSIKDKINDYSEEELREWIKQTFPKYTQRQDDLNYFEYKVRKGKIKQEHSIDISKYMDTETLFIGVGSNRLYGNYLGRHCPCDTFEEVIETQKETYEYIQEEQVKEIKHYETIPLF